MQFRRVPHAVTPTGQRGNAGAGNDNSDAESSQCPSDADPVTPIKLQRNEFELDNDKDASEEWSQEETAVIEDPQAMSRSEVRNFGSEMR